MSNRPYHFSRRGLLKGGTAVLVGGSAASALICKSRIVKAEEGDGEEEKPAIYPNQDDSEVRWGFLIDLGKCTGCTACSVACKTENDVRLGTFRNGVRSAESGQYPDTARNFVPWLCNQCAKPPCIEKCPTEALRAELTFPSGAKAEYWARATYQRPDGLVLVDQDRCVGCGNCVTDCPYGARYLDRVKPAGADPATVGLDITDPKAVDKCTMCVHRLENGVVPACVNTCPPGARMIGNLNDPDSDISKAIAKADTEGRLSVLLESAGTEPKVFYIDLDPKAYGDGWEVKMEAGFQDQVPGV